MRVQEQIIRTGYFWLPATPDQQLHGTLSIRDGGEAELEVVGNFDINLSDYNSSWSLPRLVGRVEKDGLVTLDQCHYTYKSILGAVSKSRLSAGVALFGAQFSTSDELKFNQFRFGVEGLEEWINISGVKITYSEDLKHCDISHTPPTEIRFPLNEDLDLTIVFSASITSGGYLDRAKITERVFFSLESKRSLPLAEFTRAAMKLTNFLSFAIGSTVCINSAHALLYRNASFSEDHAQREQQIRVFYPSIPHTEKPTTAPRHSYLFAFSDIDDNVAEFFTKWLNAYEDIGPSVNLYFSVKNGGQRYAEPRFLALAQTIETLHRRSNSDTLMPEDEFRELLDVITLGCPADRKKWLIGRLAWGNEPSLRQRLAAVAAPYTDILGGEVRVKSLIKRTTDTRNYLTHYDPGLQSRSAHGIELVKLSAQLEALFELHLLQRIGFVPDQIRDLVRNSYRFSQNLRWSQTSID